MNKRRVVITGLGTVNPLALDTKNTWQKLIAGESGISKIENFDASDLPCQIAGEIKNKDHENGFDPEQYVNPKDVRKMDNFIIYGMAAATEAVKDAKLDNIDNADLANRIGVMLGSGIGGLQAIEKNAVDLHTGAVKRLSPFFIPSCLVNLLSGHVSMKYGFKGPNSAVVTACATGVHALGDAMKMIQNNIADVMVAGSAEAPICKIGIAGFASAKALATNFNDTPKTASRPWDKNRAGFVMGEGAGVLVIEEYEHAVKRGAHIYAEIVGYGLSGDAYHLTAPHPEGDGAIRAMQMAVKDADINYSDIDYINAHGTSTPMGDMIELKAAEQLFYTANENVKMSSTKSAIGHLLGAAGSVEAIFATLALQDQIIPPTLNLDNPEDDIKIDLVPNKAQKSELNYVLSNSFGFGGTNASLIFKKI